MGGGSGPRLDAVAVRAGRTARAGRPLALLLPVRVEVADEAEADVGAVGQPAGAVSREGWVVPLPPRGVRGIAGSAVG